MESDLDPIPDPSPATATFLISRSPTLVSDSDFSPITQSNPSNILLDFCSDSGSDRKEQEDILLHFDSGGSVDEDSDDSETGTVDEESNSSVHAVGMSCQPGKQYTEFDFDFLDEKWLELNDESEDLTSSRSGSTDL